MLKILTALWIAVSFFSAAFASDQEAKVRGTLFGLAYGDALGAVVEMWTPEEILRVYGPFENIPSRLQVGTILKVKGLPQAQYLRYPGMTTDDTQQALALTLVALEHSEKSLKWTTHSNVAWSKMIVQGFERKAWRGYGKKFKAAAESLANDPDFYMSGSPSAGIGAAMRTAVFGALFRDDPAQLSKAVMESSLITHADIRAAAVAYAVAFVCSEFIRGRSAAEIRAGLPLAVQQIESDWASHHREWEIDRSGGHEVSQALAQLFSRSYSSLEEISKAVAPEGKHPNDPFALLGGLHALGLALASDAPPAKILSHIVRQGNDADTVAAMTGAMLGARYGAEWIPTHELAERGRLSKYADALVARDHLPETKKEFFQIEVRHLERETSLQQKISRRCARLLNRKPQ